MSTRQENEQLRQLAEGLRHALKESQEDAAAHLRNLETLADKAARTDEAEAALVRTHADRKLAWERVADLERRLVNVAHAAYKVPEGGS